MLLPIMTITAALIAFSLSAMAGEFVGKLEFDPPGCEQVGTCKLKNDFGYIDSEGVGWQVISGPNGLETDGASIPNWAQPFIGGQFDEQYIKAAIIHDHYCWRHVRPWRKTHWAFYDALVSSNVPRSKALLMYFAVYLAGPKWIKVIEGSPCALGDTCIRQVPDQRWPSGTTLISGVEGGKLILRGDRFDDPALAQHLRYAEKFIADRESDVTLGDLEELASSMNVGDFFYSSGDSIVLQTWTGIDR